MAARLGYDPFFPWAKQTVVVQINRQHGKYLARLQLVDEQGVAHGNREARLAFRDVRRGLRGERPRHRDRARRRGGERGRVERLVGAGRASFAAVPAGARSIGFDTRAPSSRRVLGGGALRACKRRHASPGAGFSWAVSIDALASTGVAPAPAPGIAIGGTLALRPWSLSLELRADAAESRSRDASLGGGSVASSLYAAQLVPCANVSYLAVCGLGVLGVTEAWGSGIVPQDTRSTLFAAAGARVGVELPVGASFFLRAHVDGLLDLHRATLSLGQQAPDDVWSAPAFGGSLGIGLAHHFR